ncbi:aminoglycoside phosphotransferase family protein [Yinghuangia sp. KLBMP8922]|uniref:Aminoglycoside phosphotransferase family protein n=1 Tax=Yinghuangia soli TaxID=2908204 RepID=A0AA41U0A5_9ACTN|nr:aminoglycoside phosphotransferase family protein [Yinghuangia soli]
MDTAAAERAVLARACNTAGIDPGAADGAELLAFGENAVFALPGVGIVARIARGPHLKERARREVAVAQWLCALDFPTVRPAAAVPVQPLEVSERPVTFWEILPPADGTPDVRDLAKLLKRLHALPEPPFALPRREPLALVETWLDSADAAVHLDDRRFLLDRKAALAEAYAQVRPVLAPGVIHGDALLRNVGVHGGRAVLLDLENVASDLRELDLILTPMAAVRYGLPEGSVERFARKYGFDVTGWDGYPVLRDVRELAATAWVAQHVPGNPAAEEEFAHRVRCLRTGDTTSRWHAF